MEMGIFFATFSICEVCLFHALYYVHKKLMKLRREINND